VISQLHRRHHSAEFRKFLIAIDKAVLADPDIHLVTDNYGTHKTPETKAWLARHPRFHRTFTSTGSSWINQRPRGVDIRCSYRFRGSAGGKSAELRVNRRRPERGTGRGTVGVGQPQRTDHHHVPRVRRDDGRRQELGDRREVQLGAARHLQGADGVPVRVYWPQGDGPHRTLS
jgi:hypothetical protein